MPRSAKKGSTKKRIARSSKAKTEVSMEQAVIETAPVVSPFAQIKKRENMRSFWIGTAVVVLVIIGALAFKNGWIVSATVDGQPIYSWQLQSELSSKYSKQTLEGMITEKMIALEAAKQNVVVKQEDVDAREKEMLKEFGDTVKIEDVLAMQGMTKSDFDKQVAIQLSVEKLLVKGFTLTDNDIANYISTNSGTFTATDEAGIKEEARKTLENGYISKTFQSWFTGLKEKANVVRFAK